MYRTIANIKNDTEGQLQRINRQQFVVKRCVSRVPLLSLPETLQEGNGFSSFSLNQRQRNLELVRLVNRLIRNRIHALFFDVFIFKRSSFVENGAVYSG